MSSTSPLFFARHWLHHLRESIRLGGECTRKTARDSGVRRYFAMTRVTACRQWITFKENWICLELPAVRLISPKPGPSTIFEGRPKFTMLNTLKNSARNCRDARATPARSARGVPWRGGGESLKKAGRGRVWGPGAQKPPFWGRFPPGKKREIEKKE